MLDSVIFLTLDLGEKDFSKVLHDCFPASERERLKCRLACFLQEVFPVVCGIRKLLIVMDRQTPREKQSEIARQVAWLAGQMVPGVGADAAKFYRQLSYGVGSERNIGVVNLVFSTDETLRVNRRFFLDRDPEKEPEELYLKLADCALTSLEAYREMIAQLTRNVQPGTLPDMALLPKYLSGQFGIWKLFELVKEKDSLTKEDLAPLTPKALVKMAKTDPSCHDCFRLVMERISELDAEEVAEFSDCFMEQDGVNDTLRSFWVKHLKRALEQEQPRGFANFERILRAVPEETRGEILTRLAGGDKAAYMKKWYWGPKCKEDRNPERFIRSVTELQAPAFRTDSELRDGFLNELVEDALRCTDRTSRERIGKAVRDSFGGYGIDCAWDEKFAELYSDVEDGIFSKEPDKKALWAAIKREWELVKPSEIIVGALFRRFLDSWDGKMDLDDQKDFFDTGSALRENATIYKLARAVDKEVFSNLEVECSKNTFRSELEKMSFDKLVQCFYNVEVYWYRFDWESILCQEIERRVTQEDPAFQFAEHWDDLKKAWQALLGMDNCRQEADAAMRVIWERSAAEDDYLRFAVAFVVENWKKGLYQSKYILWDMVKLCDETGLERLASELKLAWDTENTENIENTENTENREIVKKIILAKASAASETVRKAVLLRLRKPELLLEGVPTQEELKATEARSFYEKEHDRLKRNMLDADVENVIFYLALHNLLYGQTLDHASFIREHQELYMKFSEEVSSLKVPDDLPCRYLVLQHLKAFRLWKECEDAERFVDDETDSEDQAKRCKELLSKADEFFKSEYPNEAKIKRAYEEFMGKKKSKQKKLKEDIKSKKAAVAQANDNSENLEQYVVGLTPGLSELFSKARQILQEMNEKLSLSIEAKKEAERLEKELADCESEYKKLEQQMCELEDLRKNGSSASAASEGGDGAHADPVSQNSTEEKTLKKTEETAVTPPPRQEKEELSPTEQENTSKTKPICELFAMEEPFETSESKRATDHTADDRTTAGKQESEPPKYEDPDKENRDEDIQITIIKQDLY